MQAKQLTEITNFLQQAQTEAKAYNWLEVNYYLQQLPIWSNKSSFAEIELENKAQILQLALSVLVNGEFQQKWHIAKLFPQIGNYSTTSLISLLTNETIDNETKWLTARILGDFQETQVVIALATLLQNTSESDLIAIATESLAKIGIPAIETLITLLDTEYRLFAAKALAYIRLTPVLPALLELATDENPEIRLLAIEALGSFHNSQIPPVLIRALQDTNSMVRKEAVIALGFFAKLCEEMDSELNSGVCQPGQKLHLVSHLQPLLYDLNLDVSRQAAIALGKISKGLFDHSATQALDEVLRSQNTPLSLQLDIVKALAWSENSLALDYLQAALKTENKLISQEIMNVLGRIETPALKPKAISILLDFWHSSPVAKNDFEFKKALATALGELKAESGQQVLEQLAHDENKMIQLYAIASLKKLNCESNP